MERAHAIAYEQEDVAVRNILAAHEYFDQADIEQRALQLIEGRSEIPEAPTYFPERQDNARTALMEALTASGHLSRIELHGTLEEINSQVLSRLLNGWDDSLPAHEKQRRFAELCEELIVQLTHQAIVKGELPPDIAVSVISDYPEALDNEAATSIGYRVKNKKGMVRSTHLHQNEDGSFTRIIEQVSRSNGIWPSTFSYLESNGIKTEVGAPDITALMTPILYDTQTDEYANGVVDIMRRLDEHAGVGVLYGNKEPGIRLASYDNLREESARREQDIEGYIDGLAQLEKQLSDIGISQSERNKTYGEEIDRILTAICSLNPEYAEDTYGKASANIFYQASNLIAQGNLQQAQQLLLDSNHLKETVTFCGMSISVEKAKEMGLKVNEFGDLVDKGKESWSWKKGVCRIEKCPTRPGKTKIGPCSICEGCQAKFDKGEDPTKDD